MQDIALDIDHTCHNLHNNSNNLNMHGKQFLLRTNASRSPFYI